MDNRIPNQNKPASPASTADSKPAREKTRQHLGRLDESTPWPELREGDKVTVKVRNRTATE